MVLGMSRRPVIGITTSERKSRIAWFFDWLAVYRAGGRPMRLSPGRSVDIGALDGLVIGGGDDIEAHLYDSEVALDVRIDPDRDRLELELLKELFPLRIPILGICRGAQMTNVFLGGTLHGEISDLVPGKGIRRTVLPRMDVKIERGSRLHRVIGLDRCRVNSLHHQAVDRLGDGLRIVAWSEDGIVQGIEGPGHPFLVGVQWHPEFLVFSRAQQRLFRALVEAADQGNWDRVVSG